MSLMSLSEKSQTRSYGLLSSRISDTILRLETDSRAPNLQDREILSNGLELIDKFILGSRLVEGDDFTDGLLPTTDSLQVYRYARRAVVETLHKDERISQVLKAIRDKLESTITATDGGHLDRSSLSALRLFFTALSTLLCQDIIRQRFEGEIAKDAYVSPSGFDEFEAFGGRNNTTIVRRSNI